MKRLLSSVLVAATLVTAPLLATAADSRPDATIDISGNTVAVGVGYSKAHGTLHFDGKSYPVQLEGLSVGSVGAATITASGDVYHLAKLADFDGNYTAVSAGATLGGGGAATTMQNQNGVVIELRSTTEGAQLNLSVDGLALKVTK